MLTSDSCLHICTIKYLLFIVPKLTAEPLDTSHRGGFAVQNDLCVKYHGIYSSAKNQASLDGH
jgi:hypothetical protein